MSLVPFSNQSTERSILALWQQLAPRFPILSMIARNILAVPIASVGVERLFSTAARLYSI